MMMMPPSDPQRSTCAEDLILESSKNFMARRIHHHVIHPDHAAALLAPAIHHRHRSTAEYLGHEPGAAANCSYHYSSNHPQLIDLRHSNAIAADDRRIEPNYAIQYSSNLAITDNNYNSAESTMSDQANNANANNYLSGESDLTAEQLIKNMPCGDAINITSSTGKNHYSLRADGIYADNTNEDDATDVVLGDWLELRLGRQIHADMAPPSCARNHGERSNPVDSEISDHFMARKSNTGEILQLFPDVVISDDHNPVAFEMESPTIQPPHHVPLNHSNLSDFTCRSSAFTDRLHHHHLNLPNGDGKATTIYVNAPARYPSSPDMLNLCPNPNSLQILPGSNSLYNAPNRKRILSNVQRSSLWFSLQPARSSDELHGNSVEERQQHNKIYLRIRDDTMTISIVKRYVAHKLGLSSEDEVQIKCRGNILIPSLTIQYVRDNIWVNEEIIIARESIGYMSNQTSLSRSKDNVMALVYDICVHTLTLNLLK